MRIDKGFTTSDLGGKMLRKLQIKLINGAAKKATEKLQEKKAKLEEERAIYDRETPLPKTEADIGKNYTTEKDLETYQEEMSEWNDKIANQESLLNKVNAAREEALSKIYDVNYSDSSVNYDNINDFFTTVNDISAGYIDTKPEASKKRIEEMIKNLAFQPAFFSGSKADFKTRMEFLAKLTRPANNTNSGGFSFTLPPVCHIRLGDWLHHDIIVNSVSYDYTDSPWTFDGKVRSTVQPMWANVTISFNIIGPAGGGGGVPLTSSAKQGFFGTKTEY
jgi:hypothetical protein